MQPSQHTVAVEPSGRVANRLASASCSGVRGVLVTGHTGAGRDFHSARQAETTASAAKTMGDEGARIFIRKRKLF